MRRNILFLLLSSLLAALFVPSASGQFGRWCPPNQQLGCVLDNNMNVVDYVDNVYRTRQLAADVSDLIWNSARNSWGYYAGGQFVSVRRGPRGPIGKRESAGWGAGIGAAIGGAGTGNWRGTAGGAGVGALVGLILGGRGNKNQAPEQEYGYQQPVVGTQPLAGPAASRSEGEFELVNGTRFPVDVYDGKTFIGRLEAGEPASVSAPIDRYWGYVLIPNQSGGITSDRLIPLPQGNGWVFVTPPEAAGRR